MQIILQVRRTLKRHKFTSYQYKRTKTFRYIDKWHHDHEMVNDRLCLNREEHTVSKYTNIYYRTILCYIEELDIFTDVEQEATVKIQHLLTKKMKQGKK